MTSLNSTRQGSQSASPTLSSAPSVTDQDTLFTAIEKLRQKALILQNRQQTSLQDYEQSEKRYQTLKTACEEAEARNTKLTQKIDHYRNDLQVQIKDGLDQHRDMLTQVQSDLEQLKDRNHQLEDNRQKLVQTALQSEGQAQQQLASIQQELDAAKIEHQQKQQKFQEQVKTADDLKAQVAQLKSHNDQLIFNIQKLIVEKLAVTDEDYSLYLKQAIRAIHGRQQQTPDISQIVDLNSIYSDAFKQEINRPKVEEAVQINQPSKNMLASVSIVDHDDNETQFQQYVAEDQKVKRKLANGEEYDIQQNYVQDPQDQYYQYNSRNSTLKSKLKTKSGIHGASKTRKSQFKNSIEDSALSLSQSKVQRKVDKLYKYSPAGSRNKTLRTRSREDILISLKVKIQDLLEEKARLLRRLEAVQKSYIKGRDKELRLGQIRGDITRCTTDIKMLQDRKRKIQNLM